MATKPTAYPFPGLPTIMAHQVRDIFDDQQASSQADADSPRKLFYIGFRILPRDALARLTSRWWSASGKKRGQSGRERLQFARLTLPDDKRSPTLLPDPTQNYRVSLTVP